MAPRILYQWQSPIPFEKTYFSEDEARAAAPDEGRLRTLLKLYVDEHGNVMREEKVTERVA